MIKKLTPETDAVAEKINFGVDIDFARNLERERDEARLEAAMWALQRDEAREAAAKWESSSDAMERAGAEQARRADENREWALKAERERDEARAERDILRSNKMSDPLLETTFKHLIRERDDYKWQLHIAKGEIAEARKMERAWKKEEAK